MPINVEEGYSRLTFPETRRIEQFISIGSFLITIGIMPTLNYDAVTVPKLVLLSFISFGILGILLAVKAYQSQLARNLFLILFPFVIGLSIVMILGNSNWQIQFYGVVGRGTGWLTYLCFAILFFASAIVSSIKFGENLVKYLMWSGYAAAGFGLVQYLGFDPIPWENPNNAVITTFGNPNFASAHLGICVITLLPNLLNKKGLKSPKTAFDIFFVLVAIFLCIVSDSAQGILLIAFLAPLVIYLILIRSKKRILRSAFLLSYFFITLLGLLAFFDRGLLSKLIYQTSFQHRRDMWTAALTITESHPINGIGLDSFGFWYRSARNASNIERWGLGNVSDSAHNVLLDFASNGGILLLFAYLVIVTFVMYSIYKLFKLPNQNYSIDVSISFGFIAYFIQSCFSINQIGIAIWGWVFGGFLVGRSMSKSCSDQTPRKPPIRKEISPLASVLTIFGLTCGLAFTIPVAIKDANFRNSLVKGDGIALRKILDDFPKNTEYYVVAGIAYANSGFDNIALETALEAVKFNERDFDSWKLIFENPNSSSLQKELAKTKLLTLDPFYHFD